ESDPHQVLEAMAIAGYAIGAEKGIVYIRIEYPLAVATLKNAIAQARSRGFLGKNIFGRDFSFDIEIRLGAGAFVCGEETALIHSMEGKRGEPTIKPPYPGEKGYLGYPTNVNNVETFAHVPKIISRGYEWYRGIGTERSPGTKVFALVGKIERTGLVEVPMGVTLRDIIYRVGGGIPEGKKFKAVQTGGPSGGSLSESELDLKLDYENLLAAGTMMGSGGMIVMDEDNNMVEVAKFYLDFSRSESCGKCSPCRIGTTKLYQLLDDFTKGKGSLEKLLLLEELGNTVKRASLCGLGKSAPNPLLSTIKKFRSEYLKGCGK
ncbi:MAG: complex I 51 kDa subunit family protein, partial [Fusobacteriaceae bacterium]